MDTFIILYIVFYTIWSAFGIRDNIQSRRANKIVIADLIVGIVAVLGMFTFYMGRELADGAWIWKVALIGIMGWEMYLGKLDYEDMLAEPDIDLTSSENKTISFISIFVIAPLLYFPCLYMIFHLAFLD